MSAKLSLLDQLKAGKITTEEYVAQTQILLEKEEAKRIAKELKELEVHAKKLEEDKLKLEEVNGELVAASQVTRKRNAGGLYGEMMTNFVGKRDVTYFVELCDLLVNKVLQETGYEVKGIFDEHYADCSLLDVLVGFAALKQKDEQGVVLYPTKITRKKQFKIGDVEYATNQFIIDMLKQQKQQEDVDVTDEEHKDSDIENIFV